LIQGAPNFAVEVLSPGDSSALVAKKVTKYFGHGARRVWVVDSLLREMQVFTRASVKRILRTGETLEGGSVLPGLKLAVAKVFV
jgi:Uma2 family endonuclease